MLLFHEGQVQGGCGTCLNYPCDNSLYNERVSVSTQTRTQMYLSSGRLAPLQCKYSFQVCIVLWQSVTCMTKTLYFYTIELSLWFRPLFTDSVMLMDLFGSQGSFLPRGTCCPPSYSQLTAHYSPIMMLS